MKRWLTSFLLLLPGLVLANPLADAQVTQQPDRQVSGLAGETYEAPSADSYYRRPGGVDRYLRPGGVDHYLRP